MERREYLTKGIGSLCLTASLVGCSGEVETATPSPTPKTKPTVVSSDDDYPSFSGQATISGKSDYWAHEFKMTTHWKLEYEISNQLDSIWDFDVFVFTGDQFREYTSKVNGNDGSPNSIRRASKEEIEDSVSKTISLKAGTFYLVVDNTDIGDAGDFGPESKRKVDISITTSQESTPSPEPTEEPTDSEIATPKSVPDYEFVELTDVSYTTDDGQYVVRARIDIRVENPCELSKEEYLNIAQDIVAKGTAELDLNAITIFVWSEFDVIGQSSAFVNIDWAPEGDWAKAHEVEAGEYGSHEFAFERLYRWDSDC